MGVAGTVLLDGAKAWDDPDALVMITVRKGARHTRVVSGQLELRSPESSRPRRPLAGRAKKDVEVDLPGKRNRSEMMLEARGPGQQRRTRKAAH